MAVGAHLVHARLVQVRIEDLGGVLVVVLRQENQTKAESPTHTSSHNSQPRGSKHAHPMYSHSDVATQSMVSDIAAVIPRTRRVHVLPHKPFPHTFCINTLWSEKPWRIRTTSGPFLPDARWLFTFSTTVPAATRATIAAHTTAVATIAMSLTSWRTNVQAMKPTSAKVLPHQSKTWLPPRFCFARVLPLPCISP